MYYKAKLIGRYKRHFFKKTKKINRKKVYKNKVFKILFILSLILNNFEFDYFNNNIKHIFKIELTLRIFIMTHKDFENFKYNPAYIYQLFKNGKFTSKYIGLNHYGRYFNFTDNIPDIDSIFEYYDVILKITI